MSLPTFHAFESVPSLVAPLSQAVEVDGWVFLAGQVPTVPTDISVPLPETIEEQTEKTMENLKLVLSELGLGLENVVMARVFLTDFKRDYAGMNSVYARYFPDDRRPARTTVGVTDLALGARIEIDVVARRP